MGRHGPRRLPAPPWAFPETACPVLFVAGSITGVAESYVAAAQGRLAGLSAARAAGRLAGPTAEAANAPVLSEIEAGAGVRPDGRSLAGTPGLRPGANGPVAESLARSTYNIRSGQLARRSSRREAQGGVLLRSSGHRRPLPDRFAFSASRFGSTAWQTDC